MDNETKEISIQDLLSHSFDQKPIEFGDAFNTLMGDRVAAAGEHRVAHGNGRLAVLEPLLDPGVALGVDLHRDRVAVGVMVE